MLKKLLLPLCLILTACGGGGSDSAPAATSGNGQSLTFTAISPSQMNLTTTDGANKLPQQFSVSYSGTTNQPLVIAIEDSEGVYSSGYVSNYNNGVGTLVLNLTSNLKAGTYQKDVKIHACTSASTITTVGNTSYAECRGEYAGSPLTIKRNIVVKALAPNKTSLSFSANGAEKPAEQIIELPMDQLNPTANWAWWLAPSLSLSTIESQFGTPKIVGNQIKIQPNALAPGHYEATLSVGATGYLNQQIKLSYYVGAIQKHGLTLATSSITASSATSQITSGRSVDWTLNNPLTKVTSVSSNQSWLVINSTGEKITSGLSTGWYFSTNTNSMAVGSYSATITIQTNTLGLMDSYTVPVTLTVN